MDRTNLDGLVEYPVKALYKIGGCPEVIQLLTDNPDVEMDSDAADDVFDKYLFDYGYVDSTTEEAAAYICAEADCMGVTSMTMQGMRLYITVYCHKSYMDINVSKFRGMAGNRRDNLVRLVDNELNGSDIFGIGALKLDSARVVPAPTGFTARELTYSVPDFARLGMQ